MNIKQRRINKYYERAISITKQQYLDYSQLHKYYDILDNLAYEYMIDTSDKIIILSCDYHNDELIFIEYITRFSTKYLERLKQKLARVKQYCSKYHDALFLTLTIDPARYYSAKDMYMAISQAFNKLMTYLRKYYNIKYYIKTVEFTKSHLPHLHILLFHNEFIDINKVRELWDKHYNIASIMRIEYIKTLHKVVDNNVITTKPIDYILKYILKTYDQTGHTGNTGHAGHTRVWQWALRARAFSLSKQLKLVSLTYPAKTNSNSTGHRFSIYTTIPIQLLDLHKHYTIEEINRLIYQYYGERGGGVDLNLSS